jgi:hypothetical protein
MKTWLAIAFLIIGVTIARAIPESQQIIIFNGGSSASGSSGGGGGCTGTIDLSTGCAQPMLGGL